MSRIVGFTLIALAAFAGCSTQQYRYIPVDRTAGPNDQARSEVMYSEPRSQPQGQVRVLSFGVVTMKPKEGTASHEFPALHLRLIFSNQSNQTWAMTSDNQLLSFPNQSQGPVRPVFLNADQNSTPNLQVAPNELRVWDLFYPLPQNLQGAENLPTFDLHWSFQAGSTPVAEVTSFTRLTIPDYPIAVYPDGYYRYYGPYYPWGWDYSDYEVSRGPARSAQSQDTGSVIRMVRGPDGRVDGLVLSDHTFVGFNPESVSDPTAIGYGDTVEIHGSQLLSKPNRVFDHVKVYMNKKLVLDDTAKKESSQIGQTGKEPIEPSARFRTLSEQGRIFCVTVRSDGWVDRLFLESGSVIRTPPNGYVDPKKLQLGQTISAQGFGSHFGNTTFIHALSIEGPDRSSLIASRPGSHEPWRVKTGNYKQALVTPSGEIDGVLLSDNTAVRFSPVPPAILSGIGEGAQIQASGPAHSNQLLADRMYLPRQQQVLDTRSEGARPTQQAGVAAQNPKPLVDTAWVQTIFRGSNGQIESFVLNDGVTVRVPETLQASLSKLSVGKLVEVKGSGGNYSIGTGLEASSVLVRNVRPS